MVHLCWRLCRWRGHVLIALTSLRGDADIVLGDAGRAGEDNLGEGKVGGEREKRRAERGGWLKRE